MNHLTTVTPTKTTTGGHLFHLTDTFGNEHRVFFDAGINVPAFVVVRTNGMSFLNAAPKNPFKNENIFQLDTKVYKTFKWGGVTYRVRDDRLEYLISDNQWVTSGAVENGDVNKAIAHLANHREYNVLRELLTAME